jgi:hypothetical protein
MTKTITESRSSRSGKFVTTAYARNNPNTTQTETMKQTFRARKAVQKQLDAARTALDAVQALINQL